MSEPYTAQITLFAGNFPIRGWAYCNGALLAIAQNSALFSLLGTTYGGDGRQSFGLPDLRGRYPRGYCGGAGPGLNNVPLGSKAGAQTHLMTTQEMPSHNHTLKPNALEAPATQNEPQGNPLGISQIYAPGTPDRTTLPTETNFTGGNLAFNILDPYQGLNYLIALTGVYPSRS